MATTATTTAVEHIMLREEVVPMPEISPLILPCSVQCLGVGSDHSNAEADADADADISGLVLSCAGWSLGWSGYEADESRVGVSSGSGSSSSSSEADEEWEEDEEREGGKEESKTAAAVPFSILGDEPHPHTHPNLPGPPLRDHRPPRRHRDPRVHFPPRQQQRQDGQEEAQDQDQQGQADVPPPPPPPG
ncbi:hypothetical protein B0T18DRAFT_492544 [Schizothecium vesticola]|uniref:Uncharacterized protein n=1 Tax=Schizothecium vesticola TaxID=314040 RepID=A0AA40EHA1_9PEZI|nr:hypothetical protein B0T18DRAFT_492544 [Schizothecium vesticola]